jgi:THO complex subunit 5
MIATSIAAVARYQRVTNGPHRWVQHLCGLDFVPTLPPLAAQLALQETATAAAGGGGGSLQSGLEAYRRQQRAVCVVDRLRGAKAGSMAVT